MKLTFAVTPTTTVQGSKVLCEGFVVGEITESRIDKGGEATLTVRIDNKDVKDAMRRGFVATLKAALAELRSPAPEGPPVRGVDPTPIPEKGRCEYVEKRRGRCVKLAGHDGYHEGAAPDRSRFRATKAGWVEIAMEGGPRVPAGWCGMTKDGIWVCGACPHPEACRVAGICERAEPEDFAHVP